MDVDVHGRAGARHDEREQEATRKLRTITKRFTFFGTFLDDFDINNKDKKICKRSIPHQEQQKSEPDHFYLDMSKPNYLTMLYNKSGKRCEMDEQNKVVLDKDPHNFRALYMRVESLMRKKDYRMVEETLKELHTVASDEFQMLMTKAEIAMNYPDFGPKYYQRSVTFLEEVLKGLASSSEMLTKVSEPRLIKLKYDLAHTYGKIMNKGTIETFWIGPKITLTTAFKRIKELLVEVIGSEDSFYAPKSWIELADAFKKYEEKPGNLQDMETLPDNVTVDDCFEKALKLGPNDPFVLERCGRHLRQTATGARELRRANELLSRCVQLNPLGDIAYHHMGLAYRSLWLLDEGHEAKWLNTNRTKKFGEKKSMQNQNWKQKDHYQQQHQRNRNWQQQHHQQPHQQQQHPHQQHQAQQKFSKQHPYDNVYTRHAKFDRTDRGPNTASNGVKNSLLVVDERRTGQSSKRGNDEVILSASALKKNSSSFSSVPFADDEVCDSGFNDDLRITSLTESTPNEDTTIAPQQVISGHEHDRQTPENQSSNVVQPVESLGKYQHQDDQCTISKRSRPESTSTESSEAEHALHSASNVGSKSNNEVLYNRNGSNKWQHNQHSRRGNQTIPPKHPKMENEVPRHHNRRGDYHDRLRVSNPVAKNPEHTDLLLARECFEKADSIRQRTCGKYLIDLARTYISTKNFDTALRLLDYADRTDMNDRDGAYLFEQWALLLEILEKEGKNLERGYSLENIKNLYRTSLKCSASAKERSKKAFNRLKDILEEQIKQHPDDDILMKELVILRITIEDSKRAEDLLKTMTAEKQIPLIWELVSVFHKRSRPEDAKAALTYLGILAKADKLRYTNDDEDDETVVKTCQKRSKQVIEIAMRYLEDGTDTKSTLKTVYNWLLALTSKGINLEDDLEEVSKIRLMAPSSESPGVDLVKAILANAFGIRCYELFCSGSDDIPFGCVIADEILSELKAAQCVIVVMQSGVDAGNEATALHLLKVALNDPGHEPRRICRAVWMKSSLIEDDRISKLPKWNLDSEAKSSKIDSKTCLALNLLEVLFLQNPTS